MLIKGPRAKRQDPPVRRARRLCRATLAPMTIATTTTRRVILDAAIDRSVIRGTLTTRPRHPASGATSRLGHQLASRQRAVSGPGHALPIQSRQDPRATDVACGVLLSTPKSTLSPYQTKPTRHSSH